MSDSAPPTAPEASSSRPLWIGLALAAALAAAWARIHNVRALPVMADFDAAGHALNVFAFFEGRLPEPHSWSGFHPPLYHAISALGWHLLPPSVPVHDTMRFVAMVSGFGAVLVVWRVLRDRMDSPDAAAIAALILGLPVFAISTSMLGNEMTCAFFITCLLARMLDTPEPEQTMRHSVVTGLIGALALLSKSTGWVAVGSMVLFVLYRERRIPRRALACAFVVGAIPTLVAGPYYVRTGLAGGGSPLSFISGAALSPDLALVMSKQPPGQRHLADYFSLPSATFFEPHFDAPGMIESVPGLLYASAWADGHGHFLWLTEEVLTLASVLTIAGLVPTLLLLYGGLRIFLRRRPGEIALLLFGGLLLFSLLRYAWILPRFSAVKASYLLPAMLPGALALAAGLEGVPDRLRPWLRGLFLALSIGGTALTYYGWWEWWM